MLFQLKLILAATLIICSRLSSAASSSDAATEREAVVEHYKGSAVIEGAQWSSARVLNLGVHYMGAREDALAAEACEELERRGLERGTRVRIIDINTMGADQKRWEIVGEARC